MVGRIFGRDVDALETWNSKHKIDNNNIHDLKYFHFHLFIYFQMLASFLSNDLYMEYSLICYITWYLFYKGFIICGF
jgi:hypothetical protein